MIEPEREELLSAYLDGEVSPEERARVEQWLAESGELRQLRDELLSLRTDLRALPRHQVGHDLAAAVMHRSNAASPPEPSTKSAPAVGPASAPESTLGSTVAEWWNRGSAGRRFFWPVLAVAAALAILVFDARQRPTEFEVAQAPETAPASADFAEEAKLAESAPSEPSAGGKPVVPQPAAAPPPAADSTLRGSSPADSQPLPAADRAPAGRENRNFFEMRDAAPAGRTRQPSIQAMPSSEGQAEVMPKRAEVAPAVQPIVCSVTPQYFVERQFEALLKANEVRFSRIPVPAQLKIQPAPATPRTAPLESFGSNPLQALYLVHAESAKVEDILSQVPQTDKLMEGNRARLLNTQQAKTIADNSADGVQVMLVAPVDATTPTAPAAAPSR